MKHKILGLAVLSLLVISMTVKAHAEAPLNDKPYKEVKTEWTTDEVKELINEYADKYHVSRSVMQAVVKCESSYDHDIVGDGGKSYGLAQIYKPAHPTITKEQATNADFALDFMASNISKGNGRIWTCYRQIKGV